MKYRVTFEFEDESDPSQWWWLSILDNISSGTERILWDSFTLEAANGWAEIPIDTL